MDRPLEKAVEKASDLLERLEATRRLLFWVNDAIRQEWTEEIEALRATVLPTTSIAVCGATGSGKSTVLNALLGKNIMPTSGAKACTAVAIEVSWHESPSIVGEIFFMTEAEWREELEILLENLKGSLADGSSTAGYDHGASPEDEGDDATRIWQKIQACYPSLHKDDLVGMNAEDILARDPDTRVLLGTSITIAKDGPEEFLLALSRYVESSAHDIYHDDDPDEGFDAYQPSLWPLVHLVKIRCNADVLRTGAILVDLPGSADCNAARVRVMKDYLRKCDRIFLATASIRAADCKVAKDLLGDAFKAQLLMDGMYDAKTITFIVTKCDDISCHEAERGYYNDRTFDKSGWDQLRKKSSDTEKDLIRLKSDLTRVKLKRRELETQLDFLQKELARRQMCAHAFHVQDRSRKRASDADNNQRAKRKRPNAGSKHISSDGKHTGSSDQPGRNGDQDEDRNDKEADSAKAVDMQSAIHEAKKAERNCFKNLQDVRDQFYDASDRIQALEAQAILVQRERKLFCSLHRSRGFQSRLKRDFREGLNEVHARKKQKEGALSMDKTKMGLSNADVSVFTVSARDYMRITNQIEHDGAPVCFSDTDGTQIEQVRAWCHTLTASSRMPIARHFFDRICSLVRLMSTFADNDSDSSDLDRNELQLIWARTIVSSKIRSKLASIVAFTATSIEEEFDNEIAHDFIHGASEARNSAANTIDGVARTAHWRTYRATLRKGGEHASRAGIYYDLNMTLLDPLIINTMDSWTNVVGEDFYDHLRNSAEELVKKVLQTFEGSIAPSLQTRARRQITTCEKTAQMLIDSTVNKIRASVNKQRKIITNQLGPHVKDTLMPGYLEATVFSGPGSTKKAADSFRDFVDSHKAETFDKLSDSTEQRLKDLKAHIREVLDGIVEGLISKMERTMCAMWQAQGRQFGRVQAQGQLEEMAQETLGLIDGLSV